MSDLSPSEKLNKKDLDRLEKNSEELKKIRVEYNTCSECKTNSPYKRCDCPLSPPRGEVVEKYKDKS